MSKDELKVGVILGIVIILTFYALIELTYW